MKNFYITEFMDFLFVISDSNDLYLYDINNCIKGKKMNLKNKITDIIIHDQTVLDTCIVYIGHSNGEITIVSFNKAEQEFEEIASIKGSSNSAIKNLALSKSKKFLAALFTDKSMLIIDLDKQEIVSSYSFRSIEINFTFISFGKDDRRVLLCNQHLQMPLTIMDW